MKYHALFVIFEKQEIFNFSSAANYGTERTTYVLKHNKQRVQLPKQTPFNSN